MPAPKKKTAKPSRAPRATSAQRAIATAAAQHRDQQEALLGELKALDRDVAKLALKAFGTAKGAVAWLVQPALGLGGKIPLKVLRTRGGKDRVTQLLGRTEYNVLS